MTDDDFLERVQEHFGFTQFVLIGLTPTEAGAKDLDDMHIISSPSIPPFVLMGILHGALGEIIYEMMDDAPVVH